MIIIFLLNLFFAWWMWKLAQGHFENGENTIGWIGIAVSAANFANAMTMIF